MRRALLKFSLYKMLRIELEYAVQQALRSKKDSLIAYREWSFGCLTKKQKQRISRQLRRMK